MKSPSSRDDEIESRIIREIPENEILHILDFTIVKHSSKDDELWYYVEYCGSKGFISEAWTDIPVQRNDLGDLI